MTEDELYSAKVPEPMQEPFIDAQKKMEVLFSKIKRNPEEGRITIDDDRYVMIRSNSLATGFIKEAEKIVGEETAEMLLYNFAYSIGKMEANSFIEKFKLEDPIEKLSAGPIYFSFVGLAFVDIFPESKPAPDNSYFLIYEHPNTFESGVYKAKNETADHGICHFSAGYSAGWCSEAFGLELEAREIKCEAKGDDSCRFIMTTYDQMVNHLEKVDDYKSLSHT
ncbi:MAG: XylR N-terminal domain-containing protein [Promethearchaeia archaeon]